MFRLFFIFDFRRFSALPFLQTSHYLQMGSLHQTLESICQKSLYLILGLFVFGNFQCTKMMADTYSSFPVFGQLNLCNDFGRSYVPVCIYK